MPDDRSNDFFKQQPAIDNMSRSMTAMDPQALQKAKVAQNVPGFSRPGASTLEMAGDWLNQNQMQPSLMGPIGSAADWAYEHTIGPTVRQKMGAALDSASPSMGPTSETLLRAAASRMGAGGEQMDKFGQTPKGMRGVEDMQDAFKAPGPMQGIRNAMAPYQVAGLLGVAQSAPPVIAQTLGAKGLGAMSDAAKSLQINMPTNDAAMGQQAGRMDSLVNVPGDMKSAIRIRALESKLAQANEQVGRLSGTISDQTAYPSYMDYVNARGLKKGEGLEYMDQLAAPKAQRVAWKHAGDTADDVENGAGLGNFAELAKRQEAIDIVKKMQADDSPPPMPRNVPAQVSDSQIEQIPAGDVSRADSPRALAREAGRRKK